MEKPKRQYTKKKKEDCKVDDVEMIEDQPQPDSSDVVMIPPPIVEEEKKVVKPIKQPSKQPSQ